MDILESLLTPDMLFLACGAGCLGLGAALVQAWRNSPYATNGLKQRLLLAAATASIASGPILIVRGW
jgi:hypothetical protein